MKTFILSIIVTMITSVAGAQQKSFYDFTVKTIDGKDLPLSTFKGKKVLVVNVASKCGFTPQYAKLEELYEKYGKDDFVVIGFPANNFLHQEPGTNEEIKEFCTLNYGVTFPMMAKISVKGKDIAPLYQWLTHKKLLRQRIQKREAGHCAGQRLEAALGGVHGDRGRLCRRSVCEYRGR